MGCSVNTIIKLQRNNAKVLSLYENNNVQNNTKFVDCDTIFSYQLLSLTSNNQK